MLGEREAVGDLQPVLDYKAQQDPLNHFASLALFLVVLYNLQHHLRKQTKEQYHWSIKPQERGKKAEKRKEKKVAFVSLYNTVHQKQFYLSSLLFVFFCTFCHFPSIVCYCILSSFDKWHLSQFYLCSFAVISFACVDFFLLTSWILQMCFFVCLLGVDNLLLYYSSHCYGMGTLWYIFEYTVCANPVTKHPVMGVATIGVKALLTFCSVGWVNSAKCLIFYYNCFHFFIKTCATYIWYHQADRIAIETWS